MITSGGFEDATKFYRRRFNIDLKGIPGYKELSEAHDLRHVLVHRLGYTDEQYRQTYKYKKRRVSVDQPYLLEAIKQIRLYSDALLGQASKLTVQSSNRTNRDHSDLSLHVQIDSPEASELTSPNFFFLYNERYYSLRDLIRERHVVDPEIRLSLRGDSKVLRVYLRKIRALAKQDKLTILTPSKTRNVKEPKTRNDRNVHGEGEGTALAQLAIWMPASFLEGIQIKGGAFTGRNPQKCVWINAQ